MVYGFPDIEFRLPVRGEEHTDFGVRTRDEWGTYALVKGVGPSDPSAAPYEQAASAFANLASALDGLGFAFSDVVRTWIYADGILGWYADLNRARDAFFRANGVFDRFVPASTGIGWSCGGGAKIVLGAFAARGAVEREMLPSPLQCPSILPGSHEVAHVGDIDAQIACTMRAVEAIYASRGMSWRDLTGALVYLKRGEFRSAWERWLAGHPEFPRAHSRAIEADVCRPEWLFEIESDATTCR